MKSLAPTVALAAMLLALPAQAQRSVVLQARTAGDLAELCAANPKDPQGDAKINFCHGFAQGSIIVEQRHSEGKKPFCFPSPPPTRTATMSEFVSWVRASPERRTPPAVDGLLQFLGEHYPCK
jgi:Rap1a immunity proteins